MKTVLCLILTMTLTCFAPAILTAQQSAGQWTVQLTQKQQAEFAAQKSQPANTAFALSPDGAWGMAHGFDTKEFAQKRAMGWCREYLKPKRRDCFIYAVNGKIVAPPVVTTRVVSKIYKPIDGKTAPSVFGRAPVNFRGNKAAALADYNALAQSPAHRASLKRDPALEQALMNNSFMNTDRRGSAIWFEKGFGERHTRADSGILKSQFGSWLATTEGLLCMFDSFWFNGNPIGTSCMIIEQITNGSAVIYWTRSPNKKRKAQVIAGDARWGAAR